MLNVAADLHDICMNRVPPASEATRASWRIPRRPKSTEAQVSQSSGSASRPAAETALSCHLAEDLSRPLSRAITRVQTVDSSAFGPLAGRARRRRATRRLCKQSACRCFGGEERVVVEVLVGALLRKKQRPRCRVLHRSLPWLCIAGGRGKGGH